jgi:GNAT superfamily N-acetyltransferase
MSGPTIRLLAPGDGAVLESFLVQHRDTSMFLRSNASKGGLTDRGQPYQGTYCAAFDNERPAGVAAHYWNGMMILQAPRHAGELARACAQASGRAVIGFMGPTAQVPLARAALGLEDAPTKTDGAEWLYALELDRLAAPAALANGDIECRPPLPEERDTLLEWRMQYDIELLGATDTPEARRYSAQFLDRQIAEQQAWVAVDRDGALVSLSGFNAVLPDIVQLGGIYTPPAYRGRGYAKASVAGSLLVARARGATRAVLFTPTASAARSYEGIGFRRVGDYYLVLFR